MNSFYLDSSALVKRYIPEDGTAWIRDLVLPSPDTLIAVADITRVEVAAAGAARHRATRGITRHERDAAIELLLQHFDNEY